MKKNVNSMSAVLANTAKAGIQKLNQMRIALYVAMALLVGMIQGQAQLFTYDDATDTQTWDATEITGPILTNFALIVTAVTGLILAFATFKLVRRHIGHSK